MIGTGSKITIVIMIVALMGSVTLLLLSTPNLNVSAQENMTNTDQNMTNTDQNITAIASGTVSGSGRCC